MIYKIIKIFLLLSMGIVTGAIIAPFLFNLEQTEDKCYENVVVIKDKLFSYAQENNGVFPWPSDVPGKLTFSNDFVDEMKLHRDILLCPSARTKEHDYSYYYFGFSFSNIDGFKNITQMLKDYWSMSTEDKSSYEGKRLHLGDCNQCDIPVLIERPPSHRFHTCSHVLFLDGTIRKLYPRRGWPLSDDVLSIIHELEEKYTIRDKQ